MSEETVTPTDEVNDESSGTLMQQIANEIIYSPLNLILIAIITFLIYQIFKTRHPKASPPPEPEMPKLRRDFSVQELKAYDGNQPDGRVLVAVNGTVYDVTKGKRFYGPGKLRSGLAFFKITVALHFYYFFYIFAYILNCSSCFTLHFISFFHDDSHIHTYSRPVSINSLLLNSFFFLQFSRFHVQALIQNNCHEFIANKN